jgi:hypothetical protein
MIGGCSRAKDRLLAHAVPRQALPVGSTASGAVAIHSRETRRKQRME